jgi:hypothetical protein
MPAPRNRTYRPDDASPLKHEDCWAKTTADGQLGISVLDHCLNVGCVAEGLLELLPPRRGLRSYSPVSRSPSRV